MITDINKVKAFRDAAVADGWSIRPTYEGNEPVEFAATLDRDGYTMQIITRPQYAKASIYIWGPDGLAIKTPAEYSWSEIAHGVEKCNYCGAYSVKTERVGFAGRACAKCAPVEKKKLGPRYYD